MKLLAFFRSMIMTFFVLFISSISIYAQTTAFTYQGRLTDASMPANNGTYDFEFALFNAASSGTQIGTPQTVLGVSVTNESFSVQLDFGSIPFSGADRYLEIRVKKPADSSYTTLSPRQRINSTPYSIRALSAGSAVTAVNADTLDNIDSSSFVRTDSYRFIRNLTPTSPDVNFQISGTGKAGVFEASQYNIGENRVLVNDIGNNLFVGIGTGKSIIMGLGLFNTFVGFAAGTSTTQGPHNSFFGYGAGRFNTSGGSNSYFGASSGHSSTTGKSNSFFGGWTGFYNTIGNNNLFAGMYAGYNNITGNNNTMVGYKADVTTSDLKFSTAIGSNAVVSSNDTIVLGKVAGYYVDAYRPADTVQVPGLMQINTLGIAGSTPLCRNSNNEISTCTAPTALAEKSGVANAAEIKTLREQVKQQQQQIEAQQRQNEVQKQQIDALIKLICSQNTKAEVCKQ